MNHFRKVVALCTTRYSLRTDGISPFRVMLRTNGVYNLRYGVKLTWFAWRDSESLTAVSRSCRAIFKQNSRKIAQGANHRRLKTKTPGLLPGQCMWWCQWRTQEFFFGGVSTNSVADRGQRGRGSGGGSPLVRGSGGSCNLVQEISFHIVKFS